MQVSAFVGVLNARVRARSLALFTSRVTIKLILSVKIRKPILSREIQAAAPCKALKYTV